MRLLSTLPLFFLAFNALSQANTRYIEVVVKEDVELKVVSAKMSLSVYSAEAQMSELFESEENYEMEYVEEEYYSVEDMKPAERKRYEEEQQELEARDRERQEILVQKVNEFKPYTLQDLMATLRANHIEFEIQEMAMSDDYDDWVEMNELGEASDSLLIVHLLNEAARKLLMDLISDKPIDSEITDVTFETVDAHTIALAPKMAERAKKQAEGLAISVGKKVGAIQQVSNVYPGFSPALLDAQLQEAKLRNYRSMSSNNTFKSTMPSYIEVIYRYALMD